jgi:hypothetical protein
MIIGGLVSTVGPKKIMQFAFTHALGIIACIYSGGYYGLMASTFFF